MATTITAAGDSPGGSGHSLVTVGAPRGYLVRPPPTRDGRHGVGRGRVEAEFVARLHVAGALDDEDEGTFAVHGPDLGAGHGVRLGRRREEFVADAHHVRRGRGFRRRFRGRPVTAVAHARAGQPEDRRDLDGDRNPDADAIGKPDEGASLHGGLGPESAGSRRRETGGPDRRGGPVDPVNYRLGDRANPTETDAETGIAEGLIGLRTYCLIMNDAPTCRNESDGRAVVRTVLDRRREFDSPADWDALLGALAKRRRRYLLYHLAEEPRASLPDLAGCIMTLEEELLGRSGGDRDREEVVISLIHRDVPVLEDAGVITVGEGGEVIARGERFSDALALLDGAFGRPSDPRT